MYYVNKRLQDAKTRYLSMEKLSYDLFLASRKLRPYFQAQKIIFRTTYPLRQVLHKPETSGRLIKWAGELGQFDIEYKPRTAIKGQAQTDFLLKFLLEFKLSGMNMSWYTRKPGRKEMKSHYGGRRSYKWNWSGSRDRTNKP